VGVLVHRANLHTQGFLAPLKPIDHSIEPINPQQAGVPRGLSLPKLSLFPGGSGVPRRTLKDWISNYLVFWAWNRLVHSNFVSRVIATPVLSPPSSL
jgi:hypothetical protein